MAFRFSLEPVLRLRRGEQRQQELILQKMNEQVNRITFALQSIEDEIRQVSSERNHQADLIGAEIHFDQQRCDILAQRRAYREFLLQKAREQQAQAMKEFQRIWQRREALEILRRREQQAYVFEEARREQRVQDDLFLQRKQKR